LGERKIDEVEKKEEELKKKNREEGLEDEEFEQHKKFIENKSINESKMKKDNVSEDADVILIERREPKKRIRNKKDIKSNKKKLPDHKEKKKKRKRKVLWDDDNDFEKEYDQVADDVEVQLYYICLFSFFIFKIFGYIKKNMYFVCLKSRQIKTPFFFLTHLFVLCILLHTLHTVTVSKIFLLKI
jgi:hypothetical protein